MNIIKYTVILLLLVAQSALAGNQETYHRTINWEPVEKITLGDSITFQRMVFDKANYRGGFATIPYFAELLPLSAKEKPESVKISNPAYKKVNAAEKELLQNKDFPSTPEITSSRVQKRRKAFAKVSFVPIVRKNGTLYKITEFDLTVRKTPAETKREKTKYKQSSVLSQGNWYKLKLKENGIYKITYEFLEENGVMMSNIDPEEIGIFGNTGRLLPEQIDGSTPESLTENPIKVFAGEDGSFDPGDYILFFGHGPVDWKHEPLQLKFRHYKNYYTDYSYYFFTTDQGTGKRLEQQEAPSGDPQETVTTYDNYQYYEVDDKNLIESGRTWYGERLDNTRKEIVLPTFEFKNVVDGTKLFLQSDIGARSPYNSNIYLYANDEEVYNHIVSSLDMGDHRYFRTNTSRGKFPESGDNYTITVEYPVTGSSSYAWINWVELSARCELRYENEQLLFRDKASQWQNKIVEFKISNSQQGLHIWDVTDPIAPRIVEASYNNNTTSFKADASEIRQYVAFSGQEFLTPEFEKAVNNQNLHSVKNIQYLVVSHPDFLDQAKRLAEHHREHDDMDCYVTTPKKIYNEFSSGGQDVTAIRNFARHVYKSSDSSQRLKYLLLFGNASYDYKDRVEENTNYVPTFQGYNSNSIGQSYLTDDYFGLLDEGEGHKGPRSDNLVGLLDIGIGRLPAKTPEEAEIMVDKILHYNTSREALGKWRNDVCLIADDEDSNIHLRQAEKLATIVDTNYSRINLQKIYLDAYRQETLPGGERYPEVNDAINARMDKGALIMNYTGHGGESGLAHESIISTPDVENWKNYNALPLFITATCEFSRFDNPEFVSAGEKTFLNPDGGSIGLLSTTRLAFSHTNSILNIRVFKEAFEKNPESGAYPRLGDLVIASKTPMNENLYNFVLLGDPAMTLAYPEKEVVTTSIQDTDDQNPADTLTSDTLKALKKITIEGEIQNNAGNRLKGFDGKLNSTVFDKKYAVTTRANDPSSYEQTFELQDNILYKGQVSVKNGEFEFSFIVPKDINYSYGRGKLSYYARSDSANVDASGADTDVVVGGSTNQLDEDNEGPEITMYMNDSTTFSSGDVVNSSPVLIAHIDDESGVNTVGNSIGHDLAAKITNKNGKNDIVLNDFYTSDLDSYKGGRVEYPFNNLPEGEHTLTLKAWDVYNNSSEKSITFVVSEDIPPMIGSVKCYPNPFTDKTEFKFSHNQFGEKLRLRVQIFSLQGQLIKEIGPREILSDGYNTQPIQWDGRDANGNTIKKGMYIYSLIITNQNGNTDRENGKLIKTR
ncbi:MAG: type IX secretion system sortase PorU [Bacteroidales bacterium]|nr:type IX secretion system sortase PorU [Bacteroidales bacterium]